METHTPETPYFAQVHGDDPHYAGMACVVTDKGLTIIAKGYEGDFYEREEMPHHWPLEEATLGLDACHAALRAVAGDASRAERRVAMHRFDVEENISYLLLSAPLMVLLFTYAPWTLGGPVYFLAGAGVGMWATWGFFVWLIYQNQKCAG